MKQSDLSGTTWQSPRGDGRQRPGGRWRHLLGLLAILSSVVVTIAWSGLAGATAQPAVPNGPTTAGTEGPSVSQSTTGSMGTRGELRAKRTPMPILALVAPAADPIALSGARVVVYELLPTGGTGRRLGVGVTGNRGAVSVGLLAVPARVLVKVTGGRTARKGKAFGPSFAGSLTAVAASATKRTKKGVQHYFAGTTVSLPSTLLAAYAAPKPLGQWSSAARSVRKFLGLPFRTTAFAYSFDFNIYDQQLFNSANFLAQAARAGGVDRFVAQLTRAVSWGAAPHPFPPVGGHGVRSSIVHAKGGLLSSIGPIASAAGGVAKLGFSLYDVFSGQSKNDDIGELTTSLQQINAQLAAIVVQIGGVQATLDSTDMAMANNAFNAATTGALTYVNAIGTDWTALTAVNTSAQQVCDAVPSACVNKETVVSGIVGACSGVPVDTQLWFTCATFNDAVGAFVLLCETPPGGQGGIAYATTNLAAATGGGAVQPGSSVQGIVNLAGQMVAASNFDFISPAGLSVINQNFAYYFLTTSLGDAIYAGYLSALVGKPLPNVAGTIVTPGYIVSQINTAMAPTMNKLAGAFPAMPANTVLSSDGSVGGTAYLWPTQIAANMPNTYANNIQGSNSDGSPWSLTNGPDGSAVVSNTNCPGCTVGTNVTAPVPQVATMLPTTAGNYAAFMIGQNASGTYVNKSTFKVTTGNIPAWQVATGDSLGQLFDPFNSKYTSGLNPAGQTAGQSLVANGGFSESIIAQGGGFSAASGMTAFTGSKTGLVGYFGNCTPSGATYCNLLTWDPANTTTGLYDLNGGYDIGSQSGNWGSGCSGGGLPSGDNWTKFDNWDSVSSGQPAGDVACPYTDEFPAPGETWQVPSMLNFLNGNGSDGTFDFNAYVHEGGLITLFSAPVASSYCFASYSASAPPSACTSPRTVASQVVTVPVGS